MQQQGTIRHETAGHPEDTVLGGRTASGDVMLGTGSMQSWTEFAFVHNHYTACVYTTCSTANQKHAETIVIEIELVLR